MGKPEAESPPEQTPITHFSHPHPLQLLNIQSLGLTSPCSACKLDAAASVYACAPCGFVLHPKCYQLPQKINHAFNQNHDFILYPKPVYPEGLFRCDACGNHGAGFSYHCGVNGVDLHTTCASMPVQLNHQCHHHPLILTFSTPYPGNSFSCDICKRVTSKTRLYRCAACEFDVHLTCVAALVPPPTQQPFGLRSLIPKAQPFTNPNTVAGYGVPGPQQPVLVGPAQNPINVAGYSVPGPQPVLVGPAQNQFVGMPRPNMMAYSGLNQPGYGAPRPANGLANQLMVGAVNGIASWVAQSTTQAVLQGIFGGGGGGGGGGGVDVIGMGGGGANVDAVSYYDGGYGGGDGSGDGSTY